MQPPKWNISYSYSVLFSPGLQVGRGWYPCSDKSVVQGATEFLYRSWMRAVGMLCWQRTETEVILRRMSWEAADGMRIRKIRTAVALVCCNVLLKKMGEIHEWHVWRRVPADTANECWGTWHLRSSIVNPQNNAKITDLNAVRALLGCVVTSLESKFLRFRRTKELSSSGQAVQDA
jgi:hypothetical protein